MKKLVSFGFRALLLLLLNNILSLPFQGSASAQTDMVRGLAVSDEEVFIEEGQDKLTLYWAGRIAFVKPSQAPISVVVESSLTPAGNWQPIPSSRFRLISAYKVGVNSIYQKSPVASMSMPATPLGKTTQSALAALLEKGQVIDVKISLRGTTQRFGSKPIAEMDYQLKPLGYALLKSIQAGDLAEVQDLLEKGAEVDSANLQGWSALMAASSAGREDIVKVLLDKGVRVNARAKGFPIIISGNGSRVTPGATALMAAAYSGRAEITAMLLEKEAQVNAKRDDRWTPLMAACSSTSGETVRMLLDAGADKDVVDDSGYSPLAMAIINRNSGAVRLLKARGALLAVPWDTVQ
jgi:hypothetical protein